MAGLLRQFDETVETIRSFYNEHPSLQWGWRFLYGPKESLTNSHGIVLLGLNPGGREETKKSHHPDGNVYLDPNWNGEGTTWARQVHHLCRLIHEAADVSEGWESFMNQLVVSNIVPFRAPGFDEIEPRKEVIEFGRKLWRQWLESLSADLVVAIGNGLSNPSSYRSIRRIWDQNRRLESGPSCSVWNNYSIKTTHTNEHELMIGLPHLSRCQLATSDKAQTARSFIKEMIGRKV